MLRTGQAWLAAAAAVALILGCGEGRAIFNVDVLSYKPELADTVPYAVPGGTAITNVRDSFALTLPGGLGNSTVDSVSLLYGATVLNAAGSGKLKLEVFFGSDPGTVFTSSVGFADSAIVTGADTQVIGPISVPLFADTLFSKNELWVGVRASIVANAGQPMSGKVVPVSVLRLRIVLQDKFF
jgi:hypothetical protein